MTIRFKLTMAAIAVILVANSVVSLIGVEYAGRVWLREVQTRVRLDLNSARAAYDNHVQRIEGRHLPEEIRQAQPRATISQLPQTWEEFKRLKQQVRNAAVRDLERRFLTEALERSDGNVSKTAEQLGIQRPNLHALMRKYGMSAEG